MSDQDILEVLRRVRDPELGLNIVDLGLVYRAERTADAIHVEMTTTAPTCPASDLLVEAARDALAQEFPEVSSIQVRLVWEPEWSPSLITDAGREQLGWARRPGGEDRRSWLRRFTTTKH